MAVGRFAPSPTGVLHVGNLRTALVAWLFARSAGSAFLMRIEDLDTATSSAEHERSQLADLAAIGLDWDGEPVRQSARRARHDEVIAGLTARGLTYPCFCTRREIREASAAPHGPLPEGARTPVGRLGTEVSGGQKQRIALARILIGNQPVVIVDEPTEYLDEESAQVVLDALLDHCSDRCLVVITHQQRDAERCSARLILS